MATKLNYVLHVRLFYYFSECEIILLFLRMALQPHSLDSSEQRDEILALLRSGHTIQDLADQYNISWNVLKVDPIQHFLERTKGWSKVFAIRDLVIK